MQNCNVAIQGGFHFLTMSLYCFYNMLGNIVMLFLSKMSYFPLKIL